MQGALPLASLFVRPSGVQLPSHALILSTRRRPVMAVALAVAAAVGCGPDGAMSRVFSDDPALARWTRDSLLLDGRPEILFRVLPDGGSAFVVPIGTVGADGLQSLKLSERGWRQVDAEYLRAGKTLTAYRNGRKAESIRMFRGMWQPGVGPLDTLNCPVVIPMARAILTGADEGRGFAPLATSGGRPPLAHERSLTSDEIAQALENIGTLVAPSAGIASGQLSRYERRVVQVPTGINGSSTLLVEYNDPAPLPDSLKPIGERPRQFIVALDRGTYGFRQSYAFATVGSRRSPPRLEFLDFLDVDNDGVPELFFGLRERALAPLYTLVLRYENDAWREIFRTIGNRCDF